MVDHMRQMLFRGLVRIAASVIGGAIGSGFAAIITATIILHHRIPTSMDYLIVGAAIGMSALAGALIGAKSIKLD